VTHTLKQYSIEFLIGTEATLEKMLLMSSERGTYDRPFNPSVVELSRQLSEYLMSEGVDSPDIVAAGFWLRASNLQSIAESYSNQTRNSRGLTFHIAPGNVDTLFFYSMMTSLVCGNNTILRMNNGASVVAMHVIHLLNQFIKEHPLGTLLKEKISIIQYEHNDHLTSMLSEHCDVRVIWGGDQTVEHISGLPKKTTATEVDFPDRYSVAVIELDSAEKVEEAATNFCRDIQPFVQQACSSPKLVFWYKTTDLIQNLFWQSVANTLAKSDQLSGADKITQLVYLQRLPILTKGEQVGHLFCQEFEDLRVLNNVAVTRSVIDAHPGLFVILSKSIEQLNEIVLFSHCQTVAMSGIAEEEWDYWLSITTQPMKRWVRTGTALAFTHIWDGVDLIERFTQDKVLERGRNHVV